MARTRQEWTDIERNARRLACRVLARADPGVGWREAGHASPRMAAEALVEAIGTDPGTTYDDATHARAVAIVAATLGAYGGSWPEGKPAFTLAKATFAVTLEPGSYLVQVLVTDPPRARVWTHQGEGVFVGHGGKVRKVAIAYALNELITAAERDEGIAPW